MSLALVLALALGAQPGVADAAPEARDGGVSDAAENRLPDGGTGDAAADAGVADASEGGPEQASAPARPRCEAAKDLLAAAAEADARLREMEVCDPVELGKLSAAIEALDGCEGMRPKPAIRWVFPVAGIGPQEAIGGDNGSGFRRSRYMPCYATKNPGHPAHDLFVHDSNHDILDKDGNPFQALAVEDGWVLVAREGWKAGDKSKGGNYLMLYLPSRRQIAYYAHLDVVGAQAGERVSAGEVLGTVGRTGKNAWPRRSPTHLHFGLWEAKDFKPTNSYKLLRAAKVTR